MQSKSHGDATTKMLLAMQSMRVALDQQAADMGRCERDHRELTVYLQQLATQEEEWKHKGLGNGNGNTGGESSSSSYAYDFAIDSEHEVLHTGGLILLGPHPTDGYTYLWERSFGGGCWQEVTEAGQSSADYIPCCNDIGAVLRLSLIPSTQQLKQRNAKPLHSSIVGPVQLAPSVLAALLVHLARPSCVLQLAEGSPEGKTANSSNGSSSCGRGGVVGLTVSSKGVTVVTNTGT